MFKAIVISAAVASAMTCAVTLAIVEANKPEQTKAQYAQPPTPTVDNGTASMPSERFKIFYSPIARADTFLVDTQTGATWQEVADKDGTMSFQSVVIEAEGQPLSENPGLISITKPK